MSFHLRNTLQTSYVSACKVDFHIVLIKLASYLQNVFQYTFNIFSWHLHSRFSKSWTTNSSLSFQLLTSWKVNDFEASDTVWYGIDWKWETTSKLLVNCFYNCKVQSEDFPPRSVFRLTLLSLIFLPSPRYFWKKLWGDFDLIACVENPYRRFSDRGLTWEKIKKDFPQTVDQSL